MTDVLGSPMAMARTSDLEVLVAGASHGAICGVRDQAEVLATALEQLGMSVTTVWSAGPTSPMGSLQALARAVRSRCADVRPDVVLLHYSAFAYARRGVPLGVPALAFQLRGLDVPVLLFAHEFAFGWGRRGWRGTVQAVTQRAALVPLVAVSSAIVTTTGDRARFLRSRWWLPRRRVTVAPVITNIPVADAGGVGVPGRVGVFGFGSEAMEVGTTVEAVARVARRVPDAHLMLIGSPGPDSGAADRWRAAARRAGCRLAFTGILAAGEVSAQLQATQVMVMPERGGPTARKTTLAAALSHGRPVVAFKGANAWPDLVSAGAVDLVAVDAEAMAERLALLLTDGNRRASLTRAALAFHRAQLSPARVAGLVADVLGEVANRKRTRREDTVGGRYG